MDKNRTENLYGICKIYWFFVIGPIPSATSIHILSFTFALSLSLSLSAHTLAIFLL